MPSRVQLTATAIVDGDRHVMTLDSPDEGLPGADLESQIRSAAEAAGILGDYTGSFSIEVARQP